MKSVVLLIAALTTLSGCAHAAQSYDDYDVFYAAQPGAVFGAPIKQPVEPLRLYSYVGEQGVHMELRSTLDGKAVRIEVARNRITVNDKTYRFARATTFPGEYGIDIHPDNVNVFLAARTSNRPSLLCMEGYGSGSGEAGRHQQIFLLVKESNLKYKEVAELLNISVKTVEAQMSIALKKISLSVPLTFLQH